MSKVSAIHVLSRMVIVDQNHILLCKTVGLAPNFYFLPGGHIEPDESAEEAIIREILEETGQTARIKQFLGCLEYRFNPDNERVCHNQEYNLVFEGVAEGLHVNQPIPQLESHIKLHWLAFEQINDIDLRPASLKKWLPIWLVAPVSQVFQTQNDTLR